MKYFKTILNILLFNIFLLTSCDQSFLETSPLDQIAETEVWSDPALAQSYINGIYQSMNKNFIKRMKAVFCDEAHRRDDGSVLNFNKCLLTPDYIPSWPGNHETWSTLYANIRSCNVALEGLDPQNIDNKDRMIGEIKFARAFCYHQLIRLYGGVPLVTKVFQLNDDFNVPRNSYEDCVQFIVEECDAAAELLPLSYEGSDIGRATKGAALALKSRVLLHAASDLFNTTVFTGYSNPELIGYTSGDRNARWQAAKDAAKAVIDLGIYGLYMANPSPTDDIAQNYRDIFLKKETEEDIWVRFETSMTTGGDNNLAMMDGPNGWESEGNNAASGNLVDAFEMNDGTKFDWNNSTEASLPYTNREPRFYANIFYEGAKWIPRPPFSAPLDPIGIIHVGYYETWDATNNEMVIVPGLDSRNSPFNPFNSGQTLYLCRKFIDPAFSSPPSYSPGKWQDVPWRYFRYAEILLNYAEACIELGQDDEARTYINMIRTRAGLPGVTESGDALRVRYRNERRIELMYEDHRFYDVRRWVIGPEGYSTFYKANVTYKLLPDHTTATVPTVFHEVLETREWHDKAYFFPILRDEMNKNNLLVQNPGY
jgi:starch-binding outer membrane protein, SusD/RagB family